MEEYVRSAEQAYKHYGVRLFAQSMHLEVESHLPTCHYERYRLRICHGKVLSYLCAMHLNFDYVRAIPSIFCEKITVLRI
jgi:hypothetical protein